MGVALNRLRFGRSLAGAAAHQFHNQREAG
jgi:hypothetical protein